MQFAWLVLLTSFAYLAILFVIAYVADKRAERGASLASNPYVYSLSLAVFCTSWTFYGSVGRAASNGIGFLPIYLGPTLLFLLAPFLLRKILKISEAQHTTSIADFISSRYGKSQLLAGLVTVVSVIGIMPYIALQLKAISTSFDVLRNYPEITTTTPVTSQITDDTAFYVTLILALFTILFGTRRLDASEHHEGLMVAIAFESLVKLMAFLAVGLYVTFIMFGGFEDIFSRVAADGELAGLLDVGTLFADGSWTFLMLLSALAIFCLPRQFQVIIVENTHISHLDKAMWLFPLYLLAINIFVLPIAIAGLTLFSSGTVNADTFVLALPMSAQQPALALLVYIGGLSAASGMVIVAAVALSTMVCNDLLVPLLLRLHIFKSESVGSAAGKLKLIRRINIVLILFLSYSYFRLIGDSYALVTIGLVSFAAAAQFAPAIVGGVFWKGATRKGAVAGLAAGFIIWAYTLVLPSFAQSGWLPMAFVEQGPLGIAALKPQALFGLEWQNPLIHSLFWSAFFNLGLYMFVSLFSKQTLIERIQARAFVDIFRQRGELMPHTWESRISVGRLKDIVANFIGEPQWDAVLAEFDKQREGQLNDASDAPVALLNRVEKVLSGVIGSASARVVINSGLRRKDIEIDNLLEIIDEASFAVETSREVLKSVIENINQGVSMFDKGMNLIAWNQRFVEMYGLPKPMLRSGVTFTDVCRFNLARGEYGKVEDEFAFLEHYTEQAFRPQRTSFERVRSNGTTLEVERNPVAGGGVVTTYTDITARKRAEYELIKLRNLLSSIINSMPSAIVGIDTSGIVTHWNREAERINHIQMDDAIGAPLSTLFSDYPDIMQKAQRAMQEERPLKQLKMSWLLDGDERFMDLTIYPLMGEAVEGAVIRLDDVTESIRMGEMMVQSEKMLSIGGLAAGMAHEINNPLAGILQSIQVIRTRLERELKKNHDVAGEVGTSIDAINDYLDRRGLVALMDNIVESGERAAKIVSSMLGFSRKSTTTFARFELSVLMDEALEIASNDYSFAKNYDFRRVVIEREYAPDMPAVWCDGGQIKQVLLNLLKNGAHAMSEQPRVDAGETEPDRFILRVYSTESMACIEVEDNGPGMSEAVHKRIFEPFFTTKGVGAGTGLGLSVSYFIITQNHGGSMQVRSVAGRGSCFVIRLPLDSGPDQVMPTQER